ncbi:MAG: succinate dehydrogenase, cytochrome b556 subunit [Steroidobacteraceae bacterium]|jgi:succinate dehydrogenase / fumarate reductase cytochrome b subunit
MSVRARPLSPYLDIYRWRIGMSMSILHRLTGAFMAIGLLALVYWLIALANGAPSYARAMALFSSPAGLILLSAWTFSFFYHLLNGLRHLLWDVGLGFERAERNASGWLVIAGAIVATAAVWMLLWHFNRP